ncbi:MAG: histidine kinase [Bacteroidales bacterium]|nr:histidine kinase [Bacteroidales bacterium]
MKRSDRKLWSNLLVSILISPYFMALILTAAVVPFLPSVDRYFVEEAGCARTDKPGSIVNWYDMNGDRVSEKLILFNNNVGQAAVKMEDARGGLGGWWDFRGSSDAIQPFFGDYDHDSLAEIYFVSRAEDSLFLASLEPFSAPGEKGSQVFLTLLRNANGIFDFGVGSTFLCDMQGDGFDEVHVTARAGHSLLPRTHFVFDRYNDTILKGPVSGGLGHFYPANVDHDAFPELIWVSSSLRNLPDTLDIPLHDSCAWLAVLDDDLQFLFEPVPFGGHKSWITPALIRNDGRVFLLVLHENYISGQQPPRLLLYDIEGRMVRQTCLDKPDSKEFYCLDYRTGSSGHVILLDATGEIFRVDTTLRPEPVAKLPDICGAPPHRFDLDMDGREELVFTCKDRSVLVIARDDYSHPVHIRLPASHGYNLSLQSKGSDPPLLFIQQGDLEHWYRYGRNPWFLVSYARWPGIYLAMLLLVFISRYLQTLQIRRQKAIRDKIASLQLAVAANSLEPHFILNTLNTVSSMIYKEEREKAHRIITRFSQLVHSMLLHSEHIAVTLQEEVEFLEHYLAVQQLRYGGIFEYRIDIPATIDRTMEVPKMMLQQYAENAIKHGLRPRGEGGLLSITAESNDGSVVFRIRDNGIGREAAKQNPVPGTGRGLATMEEILGLYARIHGVLISQTIRDLEDVDGKSSGTEVVVEVRGRKE